MVGRNNRVIVYALELVAQELHGQQNQVGDELCSLEIFYRNNPPTFKGRYDP